jgi:hypothetical protein
MEFGQPIFEIAVYRKSPDELQKAYDDSFEKEMQSIESPNPSSMNDRDNPAFRYIKNQYWEKHGTPYPYNQAVGWVVLVAKHDQILAEYYKITEKRLTQNCRQHPVKWQGKAFAIYLTGKETNRKIVASIIEELRFLSAESPFKGRYVDIKAFMRIAPYVNWKRLVKESR